MSRYANTQNIAATVCDSVLNKEKTFRDPIRENEGFCEATASRFVQNGEMEETLLSMVAYMDDEALLSAKEVQTFMQESRDRLKRIAEMNVENNRRVDVLVDSVRTLKQVEIQNFDAEHPAEAGDPGQRLREIYAQKQAQPMQLEMSQEKHYRDVCEAMGEKIGKAKDDDIEMVLNAASQRQQMLCPFTTKLMERPVKNKACGHNYSRAGIENHIYQNRGSYVCKCPIAGCSNTRVTLDQLEDDLRMEQMIKREQRRLDHEKEVQLTQAEAIDSDGDE